MANPALTFDHLKEQLKDIGERLHALKDDERFIVWFLRAYLADSEEAAGEGRTGQSRDQGIDALIIDTNVRAVFIVQSKYRQKLFVGNESRNDVLGFAKLAKVLTDDDTTEFDALLNNAHEHVAGRLKDARKKLKNEGYRLGLYYVTTGKVASGLETQARQSVRNNFCETQFEVFDGKRVLSLLGDYLDGVAPPIPAIDLPMESGDGVTLKQVFHRFDYNNDVDCWVFTIRGDALAEIYSRNGLRLFARNIRGFLGNKTSVNEGMVRTLKTEPDHFFYYNNGITILCDKAESKEHKGSQFLHIENPQIINGQQTSRVLAAHPKEAGAASVLVKVMQVPRDTHEGATGFDDFLSQIVQGTNWQNAISPSDLMSNDRKQIELERNLRKIHCIYLRKRETNADARRRVGNPGYRVIKKTEMAQAVAGCNLDPSIVRRGKETLFQEEFYNTIFPNSDPNYFLPRFWLMHDVGLQTHGKRERGYTKWLVLNFVWSKLVPILRTKQRQQTFHNLHKNWSPDRKLLAPLDTIIDQSFRMAIKFYKASRGTGEDQVDISNFFKVQKRHVQFSEYWRKHGGRIWKVLDQKISEIEGNMQSFEDR